MVNSSYILLQIYVEVLAVCDASMETSHLENAPARRNSALRDLQSQREIATQVLSLHTPSQVLAAKRKVGALSEAALVRANEPRRDDGIVEFTPAGNAVLNTLGAKLLGR